MRDDGLDVRMARIAEVQGLFQKFITRNTQRPQRFRITDADEGDFKSGDIFTIEGCYAPTWATRFEGIQRWQAMFVTGLWEQWRRNIGEEVYGDL